MSYLGSVQKREQVSPAVSSTSPTTGSGQLNPPGAAPNALPTSPLQLLNLASDTELVEGLLLSPTQGKSPPWSFRAFNAILGMALNHCNLSGGAQGHQERHPRGRTGGLSAGGAPALPEIAENKIMVKWMGVRGCGRPGGGSCDR